MISCIIKDKVTLPSKFIIFLTKNHFTGAKLSTQTEYSNFDQRFLKSDRKSELLIIKLNTRILINDF
jgi:hypothetical protein